MILDNLPPSAVKQWKLRFGDTIENGLVKIYDHAVAMAEQPPDPVDMFSLSGYELSLTGWCEDPEYGPVSTSTFDTRDEPNWREQAILACLWTITVAEISDEELIAMRVARRLTQSQGDSNGQ
jgi:hypothetical protein